MLTASGYEQKKDGAKMTVVYNVGFNIYSFNVPVVQKSVIITASAILNKTKPTLLRVL